jgi:hypothetical protein
MSTHETEILAHDGLPLYIRGKQLRSLLAARHQSALTTVRRALAGKVGIRAACALLDVSRTTLQRNAAEWDELREVLEAGVMPLEKRGSIGGLAGSAARWGKGGKR